MQDADYVKQLLATDYQTHNQTEWPYPDSENLISLTEFDFLTGDVSNQRNNGEPNRDGFYYQFFPFRNKRILVHRFIVAVAFGKWPPRVIDVHHLNAKPNDNRPSNLELVTRRDNNAARRVPLKDIANFNDASRRVTGISKFKRKQTSRNKRSIETTSQSDVKSTPSSSDILDKFYNIPDGVEWTGKQKGVDGCYHEATSGTSYYIDPKVWRPAR